MFNQKVRGRVSFDDIYTCYLINSHFYLSSLCSSGWEDMMGPVRN
jgi:hypothetical protein